MKILITGTTGFVAPHLIRSIQNLEDKHEIYGTIQSRSDVSKIPAGVMTIECELKDSSNVNEVIEKIRPDIIFHLAAQSFVYTSWKSPAETLTNNIIGELNILEAVRQFVPDCIVHIAGSSEEYGMPESTPIYESDPLNPLSPYGVSKVAQEKLGFQYHKSYGLKVVLTRAFNHTGPGRDSRFAEATFAEQIANPETKEIMVGNLTAVRDYTDVRDMVRAYWLAANAECYGEPMNICSGFGYKMSEVLDILVTISDRNDLNIRQDPDRMRPSDLQVLIGNCDKFKRLTGWTPEISLPQTLTDLYENIANR